jgi:UDP-2,4-diacetamido-2,4,6-trideoxy-beta-L-altropyranose hydrolase
VNISIRVDASEQIGTGHFMRCLTLADECSRRGAKIRFVSRHLPLHFQEAVRARAYEFTPLKERQVNLENSDLTHSHWLGVDQLDDAQDTIMALSDQQWDWLVVDHYALDARWESALRKKTGSIFVIDDIADRQHDCDLFLDQNFYVDMKSRYAGKMSSQCNMLLGPRYALLQEGFRHARRQMRHRTDSVKRILIFFGGVDVDNNTGRAVRAVARIGPPGVRVDVVIGAQNRFREELLDDCARHKFSCHVQTDRMAELMAAADLAVGAGGVATWERCCMGLPTVSFCTAANQNEQISDAAAEGLLYAPDCRDDIEALVERHVAALVENSYLRKAISRRAFHAVDGKGVLRVVSNMDVSGIDIRMADQGDMLRLFEWRNHPDLRAVSRNTANITWESHQRWFASLLADPSRVLLLGHRAGAPVGVVRFDVQDAEAEVSIYLVPDLERNGQGGDLLRTAERWCVKNRPDVRVLTADVLEGNESSHGLFSGRGYQIDHTRYLKRIQ